MALCESTGTAEKLVAGKLIGSLGAGIADDSFEKVVVQFLSQRERILFGVELEVVAAGFAGHALAAPSLVALAFGAFHDGESIVLFTMGWDSSVGPKSLSGW